MYVIMIRLKSKLFFIGLFLIMTGFNSRTGGDLYKFPSMKFFPPMPVDTNNPVTVQGAELGRHLFYDPILSADSNISCNTCHKQEYAFSDSPLVFSQGAGLSPMNRNTPPLFNLAWYPRFFWDGRASSLEGQVFLSVRSQDEMNLDWKEAERRLNNSSFYQIKFQEVFGVQKIDSVLIAKAIAQFEKTLLSHNSKYDRVIRGEAYLNDLEYLGFNLMNDQTKGNCLQCHTTDGDALGTTGRFSNNGLDDLNKTRYYTDPGLGGVSNKEMDMGKFKIPSLRNITLTAPYMHDGRFKTLEEVLDFYSESVHKGPHVDSKMYFAHESGVSLNEKQKKAILAMLATLTDSVFISDQRFGNPFQKK